jgi:DNA-binding beta-propeller fold protein YncE
MGQCGLTPAEEGDGLQLPPNFRNRAVGVLGSSGMGWGVLVLRFLHRAVEGRALHACSRECHVAVRRYRWAAVELHGVCVGIVPRLEQVEPCGMTLSPCGTLLLVCDRGHARVLILDIRSDTVVGTLSGVGALQRPAAVAVVPTTGAVVVADTGRNQVVVLAGLRDDRVVQTLGDGYGRRPRSLMRPAGVAVIMDVEHGPVCVVADTYNNRLSFYRIADDTLLRSVGSTGTAPGLFQNVRTQGLQMCCACQQMK